MKTNENQNKEEKSKTEEIESEEEDNEIQDKVAKKIFCQMIKDIVEMNETKINN